MDFSDIKELIRILEDSGLSELEIEEEGRRIRLQKHAAAAPVLAAPVAAAVSAEPDAPAEEPDETLGLPTVVAPMVGTFYAAPAPGEESFVKVGDKVAEGQTICIVEAMKLMNEVTSKVAGVVERILVENGEPVEFGQPLFAIRTAG